MSDENQMSTDSIQTQTENDKVETFEAFQTDSQK